MAAHHSRALRQGQDLDSHQIKRQELRLVCLLVGVNRDGAVNSNERALRNITVVRRVDLCALREDFFFRELLTGQVYIVAEKVLRTVEDGD